MVARRTERRAGTARQEDGSGGSNAGRCRQRKRRRKAAARNMKEGNLQSAAEAGAAAVGDMTINGGVAERGRGGGSGNRRDGDEEFAEHSRRRGRSGSDK